MNILFELPKSQFQRVKPLFAQARFDQPCYAAVFEGTQSARLFVDDANVPTAALMCRSYDYFIAGAVDPALRQFIKDAPEEAEVFGSFYGCVPLNDAWMFALRADAPLEVIGRLNFQWEPGRPVYDWRSKVPENGRIVPVDRALAERLDREIYPVPFVLFDWGSYDAYEQYGFGYALLIGDAIASTITAICVTQRHALISVATEPQFQRRGFATLIGARFIEETLRRGLLPVWDCDDFNVGSERAARRLGLVEDTPFVELAFADRARPPRSRGLWSSERSNDGVIVWRRIN